MRNTLLSILVLALLAAPSYAVVVSGVNLTLDPANSSTGVNRIRVDAEASYWIFTSSDDDTVNAWGNFITSLGYDFSYNSVSGVYDAELNSLEFTGGTFHIGNISLNFSGIATATSNNLGGTFDTVSPPAPVISTGNLTKKDFSTNLHKAIVNQGTMLINSSVSDDITMNFANDNMEGTADGTGTITTTYSSRSGNDYTYDVVLTMPLSITETGSQSGIDYQIDANGNFVARGQFTQTILPPNTPPVAVNDYYSIHVSDILDVPAPGVLDNDDDDDGDSLSAVKIGNPSHGDLTFGSNGGFTYDPDMNYRGTDTFTYRATDGTDSSNLATVTIDVYNNAPTTAADAYDVTDTYLVVNEALGLKANDVDDDGDFFTIWLNDSVDHGSLYLERDGSFSYIPTTDYVGTDEFTYYATDGWDTSAITTVTLNVLSPEIPGDANRDGKVDGSDVTILANNWQAGVGGGGSVTWEMGDFNHDGKVDGSDVTILANNWQYGVTTAAATVPEPGTFVLLLGVIAGFALIRRRR